MDDKKRTIRKQMMELRASMAATTRRRTEAMLAARLTGTVMWKKSICVLLFNSTFREVSTRSLIEIALASKKKLYLPRINGKDMEFFLVNSVDELELGSFGITEPVSNVSFPAHFDGETCLCVVPALACDHEGYRLGFGGGYYDRYLSRRKLKTVTIIFDDCIVSSLPHDEHDIKIDAVLTERGFVYGGDWVK